MSIPEPALHERAEQWTRERLDELADAEAKINATRKTLKRIGAEIMFQAPSEQELRTKYQDAEREALTEFGIPTVPYGSLPLKEVFRRAVARDFTFADTKNGVVGVQDCVILVSVIDHLQDFPASAALVSNDGIFSRIPTLVPSGLDLRHFSGLPELEKVLTEAQSAAFDSEIRSWWAAQTLGITQALENHREEIERFLETAIDSSEIEKIFVVRVLKLGSPTVERFGMIRPELDGAELEPLRFSCDVTVSYPATIEQGFSTLAGILVQQSSIESAAPAQVGVRRSVTVELAARVDPDFKNLTLESARIRS